MATCGYAGALHPTDLTGMTVDDRGYLWVAGTGYPSWWSDGEIGRRLAERNVPTDDIYAALTLRKTDAIIHERRTAENRRIAALEAEARAARERATAAREEQRVLRARAEAMARKCRHRQYREETVGYTSTIDNERRADGGVCFIDTCESCGSERRTNANGHHEASTGWYLPEATS